jgi:hypothetical protein
MMFRVGKDEILQPWEIVSDVVEFNSCRVMFLSTGRRVNSPRFLSPACLFDCLDNNSFCFVAGQIRDGQMCDRLSPPGFRFRIDGNLGNLYGYPWCAPINNYDLSFLFFGQVLTPQT